MQHMTQQDVDAIAAEVAAAAVASGGFKGSLAPYLPGSVTPSRELSTRILDAVCGLLEDRMLGCGVDGEEVVIELRQRPRGPLPPQSGFQRTLARYRQRGTIWGGELLLAQADAVSLVDELEALGIAILGVDGWHFVDREKGWIVQELRTFFAVSDEVLNAPDVVQRSAADVRAFLQQGLQPETELVSLTLDVPPQWELVADSPE